MFVFYGKYKARTLPFTVIYAYFRLFKFFYGGFRRGNYAYSG